MTSSAGAAAAPNAMLDDATKRSIRALANEASVDFEAGRYQPALEKFQRAYDSAKVPKLALWLARTHLELGQLLLARDLCREAMSLPQNDLWIGQLQQQAQRDAAQELANLELRIPRLVIHIENADSNVSVQIDDVQVPSTELANERLVDPGAHIVRATSENRAAEEKLSLDEGERREVTLRFEMAPIPTPELHRALGTAGSTQGAFEATSAAARSAKTARTAGWATLSVGAAGLALGATAGIVVAVKHAKLSDSCPNDQCEPDHWSDVDSYRTWRTLSTVGLALGAVATAAGVTLLLTHPSHAERPQFGLWMAPGSAGIKGSF